MAQVVEDREKSTHHMSNFPRDLLNRIMVVNHHQNQLQHHHDDDSDVVEEEIELSLGLSMNGRFGVDPTAAKKIKRTTSIPEFVMNMKHPFLKEEDSGYPTMPSMPLTNSLIRTCSLPTETEEEWRKRKELQTLRRLEARRKRSEKQRNIKALREQQRNRSVFSEEVVIGVSFGVGVEGSNSNSNSNLVEQGAGNSNNIINNNEMGGLGRTISLSSRVGGLWLNGDKEKEKEKEKGLPPPSPSRGSSIGSSSQGTGSSGISESEGQLQGSKLVDARSPIGPNSFPSCDQRSPATSSGARIAAMAAMRNEQNKPSLPENKTKDIVRNLLEDMPCVSTKGDGPNGRKIEGFLYRYGKGEEVRIVCVCHGSFLTPAEFVKHAGGGDVANPLKHIVVSPSCL